MPHPHIGALKLKPENTLLRVAATRDKIQIAVAIHIHKRCLTVGVTRQIAIDEVMSEFQFAVVVVGCSPRWSVVLWLSGELSRGPKGGFRPHISISPVAAVVVSQFHRQYALMRLIPLIIAK